MFERVCSRKMMGPSHASEFQQKSVFNYGALWTGAWASWAREGTTDGPKGMRTHQSNPPSTWLEWTNSHQCTSWGWGHWNHFGDKPKTHPPCPKLLVFSTSSLPQKFSLLPTSLPPTSPSYLRLPPPTSHLILRSLHRQSSKVVGARAGAKSVHLKLEREWEQSQCVWS